MCILIRIPAILHSDCLCRKDVIDAQNLLDDFNADRLIDKEQGQRSSAFMLPAKLHPCDIDVALPQNGTNFSNNPGPVVIREVNHVTTRNNLQRESVNIDDAREQVVEHRAGYPVGLGLGLHLKGNQIREVFRSGNPSVLDFDSAKLGNMALIGTSSAQYGTSIR